METPLIKKEPVVVRHSTPHVEDDPNDPPFMYEEPALWRKMVYDVFLWLFTKIFDCFFREIRTRGGYKVPTQGPIIFVAAPHANQFVDPVILMGQVKKTVNKRVSFIVAEKSLRRPAVGTFARCAMSIGVVRAQDNLKLAKGKIRVDPDNYQRIIGTNTEFTKFHQKGLIGLPKSLGNVEIDSIVSDTELILRKEFKMQKPEVKATLLNGTAFKYAPKVNQSRVYHNVFEHLAHDQCIGIFPEGGSHDRTDLLPLKAGVAIMALGCMDLHPDVNVKIVPCGMNYFHPHKFRSRAVVEFGHPIEISKELVAKYRNPATNREAVKELLDTITEGLKAVTVTCPDYETLMVVQAIRRLYAGHLVSKLPLPLVVEMNRRIVNGFQTLKDNEDISKLKEDILRYNSHLRDYNIPDHQVETATVNMPRSLGLLIWRSVKLVILLTLALPGIILFSPVFIAAKRISAKKAAEALAASTVKVKANDVIATWKILIGIGVAPLLYSLWSILFVWYFRDSLTKNKFLSFIIAYTCCATVTYSALISGDHGMDIFKSIRPLYLAIISPKGLQSLKDERTVLSEKINGIVNEYGPRLFPDFNVESLASYASGHSLSDEQIEEQEDRKTSELKRRRRLAKLKKRLQSQQENPEHVKSSSTATTDDESDALSMINSDNSLSNIPIFSNRDRSTSSTSIGSMGSSIEVSLNTSDEKSHSISGIADQVRKNRAD
ncbi:glycerol-3-phosphate O-acyltransferase 1 [Kluyveromyces marxianus DMKU3-1042]|uniref:Glycerol-3-phosphate O-acyltransferase 1 n=1 Tax=Kluyveromyces marxianus (strain DMKU3-1042 / BCC 29191 / NBRC 104275) TaxID=1003335 RepID=W0T7L9_KLUMD|nr:glycerol-3-phosphate O-acyltransferase 1 [Kluyveromyces marxianus DMKU3-1042]BAO39622.1 glycerol-3-phosphate O-acyltransferase 1 [Kluyveromyces marxianus DMKU3-1042]